MYANWHKRLILGVAVLLQGGVHTAQASVIIAPVSATIDVGGTLAGAIANTFSQAGLVSAYTPSVDDFDAYIGSNPVHTTAITGEWFSNAASAQVTFSLGAAIVIDSLALWNEDSSQLGFGIGTLDLLVSLDGSGFDPLVTGLTPAPTVSGVNYGPQRFDFAPTEAAFVRFLMSSAGANTVSLGEVAFRVGELQPPPPPPVDAIPEPATLMMWGLGVLGLTLGARRRRRGA